MKALGVILFLAAFFAVSVLVSTPTPVDANSPSIVCWDENNHCYERVDVAGGINWDDANAAAQLRMHQGVAGHLATIASDVENEFIYVTFGFGDQNPPDFFAWIGGQQLFPFPAFPVAWGWVTLEPFNHSMWAAGEPDGEGHLVDAIAMNRGSLWVERERTDLLPSYIVEYPMDNMLRNSSFDYATPVSYSPPFWRTYAYHDFGGFEWAINTAHSGIHSAAIHQTTPNDARWQQDVRVARNKDYLLTGWIKTENVAPSAQQTQAGANLSIDGTWKRSEPLFGTNDWTYRRLVFNTDDLDQVTVAARLGYWSGTTTGSAWYDDLQLRPYVCGDAYEPNNAWTTATPITVDGPALTGDFCPSDDVDIFAFDATAGHWIIFKLTDNSPIPSPLKVGYTLYDAGGGEIPFDGTGYPINPWIATKLMPVSGRYYLKIHRLDDKYGPDMPYELKIETVPMPPATNLIRNGDFEAGTGEWSFFTNAAGNLFTSAPGYNAQWAAQVDIFADGSNVQLYQYDIPLEPNQQYRLHFAAYSNNGQNMSVFLHKHGAPYTNYGLNGYEADLDTNWKAYTIPFSTANFTTPVTDARLRFWFAPYDQAGTSYHIDYVFLEKMTDSTPPVPLPEPEEPIVPAPGHCDAAPGNIVRNSGFESGTAEWLFYSDASAGLTTDTDRYECTYAGQVNINVAGNNVQLYQPWLSLQPNTTYRLRLAAKSTTGRNVKLFIHKHTSPYTNYGLNGVELDLTPQWQVFPVEFTTTGFSQSVSDARLRIWLADQDVAGEVYHIDDVVLQPLGQTTAASRLEATSVETAGDEYRPDTQRSGFFIDADDEGRMLGGPVEMTAPGESCGVIVSPNELWPANHKFVVVTLAGATSISDIMQDEAVGDSAPDGRIVDAATVELRAERDAHGDGRIYFLHVTSGPEEEECSGVVTVAVPHDKGKAAVDSQVRFDSTDGTTIRGAAVDADPLDHAIYLPLVERVQE